MLRWLRNFFRDPDPIVRVADGLTEYDAAIYEELLANNGVLAMRKSMLAIYDRFWRPTLPVPHFTLWVKRSDLKQARGVLADLLEPAKFVHYDEDYDEAADECGARRPAERRGPNNVKDPRFRGPF